MKKLLSLLLAAMLLVGVNAAVAQETLLQDHALSFDVTMTVPEGYTMLHDRVNGHLNIHIIPDDEAKAVYALSIAFSEIYAGQTMNTMAQEDVQLILDSVCQDYDTPAVTTELTSGGTLVCLVDETTGESDYAVAFTVYKGYFITVHIHTATFAQLHESDLQLAVDLLSGMEFVDAE